MARLPEVDPAIGVLALWCQFRDGNGPTRTAGDVIHIGAEFPLLPISEQTGLLAHHVLHVALRHSARRSATEERLGTGFQPMLFDLACDALVNEALLQGGHALPRPAVRAAQVADRIAPEDRPDTLLSAWDCEQLYQILVAASDDRSGPSGKAIQDYALQQGFAPDLEGSDPEAAETEIWAERVAQALATGRGAGSGIGAVLARFGDLPRAQVPWELRLRRLLAKALAQHPHLSHARPARQWLARDALARQTGAAQPVFEPGLIRDTKRPRLVIGLDTSSSIPDLVLDLFAAEALGAMRRSGAEAHLLGFDTEVHSRTRFDSKAGLTAMPLRRGGGTDFDAVLSEAQAYDPSLILMLTDLDAPLPEAPKAPVVWAVPSAPRVQPDFGEMLVLADQGGIVAENAGAK
ncbi:MAG: hypothetical protein HRU31_11745 [Rhodobacteraceae bacterium]|nr:hypothetical protein [Paracoccaceae bacterium]